MYFIIRNVTTKQMHIFEGKQESGGSVTLNQKSICQICSKDDSISAIGVGFNVNEQERYIS